MNERRINRRQFLQSGAIAATLLAAGRLPLLAAEGGSGSGIDKGVGEHAVKPIGDYLQRFSPSTGSLRDRESYMLRYDIVHWDGANPKTGMPANSVVGKVVIQREKRPGGVGYEIAQHMMIGGVKNSIEAQIRCQADEVSVQDWTVRFHSTRPEGGVDPLSEIKETGSNKKGRIEIHGGNFRYGYDAEHPVVTQWTVLDLLIRKASPTVAATFHLLQDLSLFKPSHRLLYDGETLLRLKGEKNVVLQTYARTGEGVLPVHYLCDERRCPHLVTTSILSWALTSVT